MSYHFPFFIFKDSFLPSETSAHEIITSLITLLWVLLLSVPEITFTGGNRLPPSLTVFTRESANILFTSQTGFSVLLNETFLPHFITHALHLHGFR